MNSASFAKKKSFKFVTLPKLIHYQVSLIGIVVLGIFIHIFILGFQNIKAQHTSTPYIYEISRGNYFYQTSLTKVQKNFFQNLNP